MTEALRARSWPSTGTTTRCTQQLDSSQFTSKRAAHQRFAQQMPDMALRGRASGCVAQLHRVAHPQQ